MDVEPDAVPEPVAEALAVPGGGDQLACGRVDGAGRCPGAHCLEAGQLGGEHELVDLPALAVDLADGERSRAVRAVAVELRPPVDRDQLAGLDLDVSGRGVRQRAVGSGGDDRVEARAARAPLAHRLLERHRDLVLGAAREPGRDDLLERLVGQPGRGSHCLDLLRLLDQAQGLDGRSGGHELDALGEQLA